MAPNEVPLAVFRRWARTSLFLSVAATVGGLYALLHQAWAWGSLGLAVGILFLWLPQRLSIRAEPGSETLLIFVTKPDCSLCEEARALLPRLTEGTPFRVQEVDVGSDRSLRRAFRHRVPVLLWQGSVLAELGWSPSEVRQRLEALRADQPPSDAGQQNP